ncbi:hypothetical protein C0Q70_20957 [Pomacea canaliculata]|uniref:Sulfatase N-terminal domain-containing protein n=1 Tax=Pomacea canaliculata TaxID=400727 RepID=A0A2T7NB64_POMCA|nr:hypothetical protein C0Q70_20957 [Pomacea canaliculata]
MAARSLLVLLACVMAREAMCQQPNIIIFLADDVGWADLQRHDQQMRTPNIERLARDGMFLNQSYVLPTCAPTRSALLTSRCVQASAAGDGHFVWMVSRCGTPCGPHHRVRELRWCTTLTTRVTDMPIREGDWKLCKGRPGRKYLGWYPPASMPGLAWEEVKRQDVPEWQLFNIAVDPEERHNVYNAPENQAIVSRMKQLMENYKRRLRPFRRARKEPRGKAKNFGGVETPGWCQLEMVQKLPSRLYIREDFEGRVAVVLSVVFKIVVKSLRYHNSHVSARLDSEVEIDTNHVRARLDSKVSTRYFKLLITITEVTGGVDNISHIVFPTEDEMKTSSLLLDYTLYNIEHLTYTDALDGSREWPRDGHDYRDSVINYLTSPLSLSTSTDITAVLYGQQQSIWTS